MAEFKHIHTKTRTWDQRPWGNLEDLVKSKFSSGDDTKEELECTCGPGLSSTHKLLISHSPRKTVRRRHAPRAKNRKSFSKITVRNSSGSSTLCDRPRIIDKSYKKVRKVKYPDVTRVKSLQITERAKKKCCSARKKNPLKSKISRTNLRSPSTGGYGDLDSSEEEMKPKNNFKEKIKSKGENLSRRKNKFKVKESTSDCEEDEEFLFEKNNLSKSKSRESFNRSLKKNSRKVFEDNLCDRQISDCSDECKFECCLDQNRNYKSSESCDCLSETEMNLKSNWSKCEKSLKNISKEYRSLSSNLQQMQQEMKPPESYKLKSATRYLNEPYEDKISDDEDTIKALTSLCETFKTMSREIDPVTTQSCKTELCNCCEIKESKPLQRRKKKGVKVHEFSFPKIVQEKSDKKEVDKMFVYAPEGDQSVPLTLYRTSSFVNCNIKNNNNEGYKYHVTYVQKYVSPTWKPNQSENYLESDYG